jgi:hypothetical protein
MENKPVLWRFPFTPPWAVVEMMAIRARVFVKGGTPLNGEYLLIALPQSPAVAYKEDTTT